MYLWRFMSNEEFNKYNQGKVIKGRLQSTTTYSDCAGKEVVCFFPSNTCIGATKKAIEDSLDYLGGIVSNNLCAIFAIQDPSNLTNGYGKYASVSYIKETYLPEYSNKTLKLECYAIGDRDYWPEDDNWDYIFEWQNYKGVV